MAPSSTRACLLLMLLALSLGCGAREPATQLIVVVESDFAPESQLRSVDMHVRSRGSSGRARVVPASAAPRSDDTPHVTLPFSFGVTARAEDPDEQVVVEVEGFDPRGVLIARDRRRVGFVREQARRLPMALMTRCRTVFVTCDADQTCRDGECVPAAQDVRELAQVLPRDELRGTKPFPAAPPAANGGSIVAGDRASCDTSAGFFSDVGRPLARSADGDICPVITQGDDWRGEVDSHDSNLAALTWYLERSLAARADFIGLNVAYADDKLVAFGFGSGEGERAAILPTLAEALTLPKLQSADQPLWLKLAEPNGEPDRVAEALLRTLRQAGAARSCRPVYLFAAGPRATQVALVMRSQLEAGAEPNPMLSWLHFGRTLTAATAASLQAELDEARVIGMDVVRLDLFFQRFGRLPLVLSHARAQGLGISLFNSPEPWTNAALCGTASGMEQRILNLGGADFRNETRERVEHSRLLLELDTRALAPGASTVAYRGHPEALSLRQWQLDMGSEATPTLIASPDAELHGGTYLAFDKRLAQTLSLPTADYKPENLRDDEPAFSLGLIVRFNRAHLDPDERQVLVSKQIAGQSSGWALELRNEQGTTELAFSFHAREEVEGTIYRGELTLPADRFLHEDGSTHLISVQALGTTLYLQVLPYEAAKGEIAPRTMHRLMNVYNDVPITIGSDPGGGAAFFDGALQLLRVVAL